jgi:DNA mismatch endonuclease (patch repair protein)
MPATSQEYWEAKIERNVQRDAARRGELEAIGWRVHIIWECELEQGIERLKLELDLMRANYGNANVISEL